MRLLRRFAAIGFIAALLCAPTLLAKNGAFRSSAHGDPVKGPMRKSRSGRGACDQCHGGHASHQGYAGARNELGLFAPNDNNLCFVCHATPSEDGIFPGNGRWSQSTHASDSRVAGGGSDPRRNAEPNRCVNCHDPHGVRDKEGVVPAMLASREPRLCLDCHDGSRGADIAGETLKSWTHGVNARGSHDPHEGENVGDRTAYTPGKRHVSCSDCHNVHRVGSGRMKSDPPEASPRLAGVSRVKVINGAAGSVPSFTFIGADDPGQANEYEICFKCHSSYTKQPPNQPNLALLTNPENPSYHPIQARGKNRGIRADAFANDFDANSIVSCSDCHASDNDRVRGPHGSRYEFLLKKEAITSDAPRAMQRDNLCFDCHSWDVYADPSSPATTQGASRFNGPKTAGHAFHVGQQRIPCYACHETHGSARHPNLIATGGGRGVLSFMQTPSGGTCTSSCHGQQSYAVNYDR